MSRQEVESSISDGTLRSNLRTRGWDDGDIDYLINLAEMGIWYKSTKKHILAAVKKLDDAKTRLTAAVI